MDSKITLSLFLILSSCVFLGFCSEPAGPPDTSCLTKLLPCRPYLQGTVQPPTTCCVPLKDMVVHQAQCLCSVFTNPDLMKNFNVTLEGGLALSKSCGAQADMSTCKNGTSTSPPGSPTTPADSTTNTTTPSGSGTPPKNAASYGMTHFGGSGFVAAIVVGLVASIF